MAYERPEQLATMPASHSAPEMPKVRPPLIEPPEKLLGVRRSRRVLEKRIPATELHCFPFLPPELRIKIWKLAYQEIYIPEILRFRLDIMLMPTHGDDVDVTILKEKQHNKSSPPYLPPKYEHSTFGPTTKVALLTPLPEVAGFTRELRHMRAACVEARMESFSPRDVDNQNSRQPLVDCWLDFLGTKKVRGGDNVCPIRLAWNRRHTKLCLDGLTAAGVDLLFQPKTVKRSIADIFMKLQCLDLMVNRRHAKGFDRRLLLAEPGHHGLADLIKRFNFLAHIELVSDLLMFENYLRGISNQDQGSFLLTCWFDWIGRIHKNSFPGIKRRGIEAASKIESVQQHTICLSRFKRWLTGWLL